MNYFSKNKVSEIKLTCSAETVIEIIKKHYPDDIADDYIASESPLIRIITLHKLQRNLLVRGWYLTSFTVKQCDGHSTLHIYRPINTTKTEEIERMSYCIHKFYLDSSASIYDPFVTSFLLKGIFSDLEQYRIPESE